jgi:hypothetical protein
VPKFLDDDFRARKEAERLFEADCFHFDMYVMRRDVEALVEMGLLAEEDKENPEAIALHARAAFSGSISDAKKLRERKAEVAAGTGPVDVIVSSGMALIDWLVQSHHLKSDRRRDPQAIASAIKDALWQQASPPYESLRPQLPMVGSNGVRDNRSGRDGLVIHYGPTRF